MCSLTVVSIAAVVVACVDNIVGVAVTCCLTVVAVSVVVVVFIVFILRF